MGNNGEEGYKFWREKLNGAKFILGPMVEQSELPWRMLTRKYGAQLCYTPMMNAGVFVRDHIYRAENFVTCPEDRPLIAQFCSDDPETFVTAAKYVENDCDAIDLNLGCPQNIAKKGHYGSFLQDEWDLIHKIISHAVANLKVPVTAKIRVFPDIAKSVEYAKMLENAGVSLLTVHGRTREQKGPSNGLASWPHIKAIKDALKIPVFANGNILCFKDVSECLKQTGCDGMMIAEPNLYNPALFAGVNPYVWDMGHEYLDLASKYPCSINCIRAHTLKIFKKTFERFTDLRAKACTIRSIEGLREVFDEVKRLCSNDLEKYEKRESENDEELPYFVCQAQIRHPLGEKKEEIREEVEQVISFESSSAEIKRHLNEIGASLIEDTLDKEEEENTLGLMKILERKRRKRERVERKENYLKMRKLKIECTEKVVEKNQKPKYISCNKCKNPKSDNCEHSLCRKCCKDKVFTYQVDCKGHGLKFRIKKIENEEAEVNDETKLNEQSLDYSK